MSSLSSLVSTPKDRATEAAAQRGDQSQLNESSSSSSSSSSLNPILHITLTDSSLSTIHARTLARTRALMQNTAAMTGLSSSTIQSRGRRLSAPSISSTLSSRLSVSSNCKLAPLSSSSTLTWSPQSSFSSASLYSESYTSSERASDPQGIKLLAHSLASISLKNESIKVNIACNSKSYSFNSRSEPLSIPNEVLLLILSLLPNPALLMLRFVSRRFRELAEVHLLSSYDVEIDSLTSRLEEAESHSLLTERLQRPHLRHYKGFLRNINSQDVTEATWYTAPPDELKTVCECLCILNGLSSTTTSPSQTSPTNVAAVPVQPLSWAVIKKHMSQYTFKTWAAQLHTNVDAIPHSAITRVSSIIMHDATITYERLREVSTAGYKLLILVAACLQYGGIKEEVRKAQAVVEAVERRRGRVVGFVEGVRSRGGKAQVERLPNLDLVV